MRSTISTFFREYKIVILGGGGVGKSAITVRFIDNRFDEMDYDPTVEDFYTKQSIIDQEVAVLQILDTAGQDAYSAMRETYMRNGEGFLLVYSIAERDTLYEATRFHEEILRVKDSDAPPPIILLGNKCDKEDERAISTSEARSVAEQLGVQFFETSAKTRINIDESFEALVREMRSKTKHLPNRGHYGSYGDGTQDGETVSCFKGCVVL